MSSRVRHLGISARLRVFVDNPFHFLSPRRHCLGKRKHGDSAQRASYPMFLEVEGRRGARLPPRTLSFLLARGFPRRGGDTYPRHKNLLGLESGSLGFGLWPAED